MSTNNTTLKQAIQYYNTNVGATTNTITIPYNGLPGQSNSLLNCNEFYVPGKKLRLSTYTNLYCMWEKKDEKDFEWTNHSYYYFDDKSKFDLKWHPKLKIDLNNLNTNMKISLGDNDHIFNGSVTTNRIQLPSNTSFNNSMISNEIIWMRK